jgi:hypothetical protein
MNPNEIVITRDNKLARLLWLYHKDDAEFAAIRYLDETNPDGDRALDPQLGICEHSVNTHRVLTGTGSDTRAQDRIERGLRRATPYNLQVAGIRSKLHIWRGVPVEIVSSGQRGQVYEVDPNEGVLYVDTPDSGAIACQPTDVEPGVS